MHGSRGGRGRTESVTPILGSSARTAASDLDGRIWPRRRTVAAALHAVVIGVPVLTAAFVTGVVADAIDAPSSLVAAIGRWFGLIALALLVALIVGRMTRRLLPLVAFYRLSLSFPEPAPDRFQLAMKRGTTRQLERSLLDGELDHRVGDAAAALLSLTARLNEHDRPTRGHSERVRAYSVMIGQELGLRDADLDRLQWSALLHDVGKLRVPRHILNKPGRPDAEEWATLRDHPAEANGLVEPVRSWLGEWVEAATQHHERIDGAGYPSGLRDREITLAARIVAVADSFDTMTAVRSYKVPLPAGQARAELARNAGTQFDPVVVRAFLSIGLPRLLWIAGPTAAIAQLPGLGQAFTSGSQTVSSIGAAVTSGAGQAAVIGSVAAAGACVAATTVTGEPLLIASVSPTSAASEAAGGAARPADEGGRASATAGPSAASSRRTDVTAIDVAGGPPTSVLPMWAVVDAHAPPSRAGSASEPATASTALAQHDTAAAPDAPAATTTTPTNGTSPAIPETASVPTPPGGADPAPVADTTASPLGDTTTAIALDRIDPTTPPTIVTAPEPDGIDPTTPPTIVTAPEPSLGPAGGPTDVSPTARPPGRPPDAQNPGRTGPPPHAQNPGRTGPPPHARNPQPGSAASPNERAQSTAPRPNAPDHPRRGARPTDTTTDRPTADTRRPADRPANDSANDPPQPTDTRDHPRDTPRPADRPANDSPNDPPQPTDTRDHPRGGSSVQRGGNGSAAPGRSG